MRCLPPGPARPRLADSRCEGASHIAGCDIYAYDLRAGTEQRVRDVSSAVISEIAPAINLGTLSFVRRGGGTRKGVYVRTSGGGIRRISPVLARETANNATRVAYTFNSSRGGGVALARRRAGLLDDALSRLGRPVLAAHAGRAHRRRDRLVRHRQQLRPSRYLDAEGLKSASPSLFAEPG